MQKYFNEEKVNQDIPGILVMSHGPFAIGLVQTAELIYGGKIESVAAISLEANDSVDDFREEFLNTLKKLPKDTIIFLDIYGGSPSNQFLMATQTESDFNYYALAGVNVPIFLTAALQRNSLKGEELVKTLCSDFESIGVVNVLEKMKQ